MNNRHHIARLGVSIALALVATSAFAGPHFVRGPNASLDTSNAQVTVTWKEGGLGDTVTVDYEASADGSARYQCVNRGGKCPAASNKQNVLGPVTASGAFNSLKNGSITGSLTFDAPAGTLVCPGNQVLKLVSASFTDIALADLTNNIAANATPSELAMSGPECP